MLCRSPDVLANSGISRAEFFSVGFLLFVRYL